MLALCCSLRPRCPGAVLVSGQRSVAEGPPGGVILELVAEDLVDMAGQSSVDELEGPEDENVFKGG